MSAGGVLLVSRAALIEDHRRVNAALARAICGAEEGMAISPQSKGGIARRDAMTPEQRSACARKAAQARWNRAKEEGDMDKNDPNEKMTAEQARIGAFDQQGLRPASGAAAIAEAQAIRAQAESYMRTTALQHAVTRSLRGSANLGMGVAGVAPLKDVLDEARQFLAFLKGEERTMPPSTALMTPEEALKHLREHHPEVFRD